MAHAKDLTGQRFGKLTALERLTEKHKSRKAVWKCRCDCGNVIKALSDKLKGGEIKSCGCLRVEKGKEVQEYNEKHLINDDVFTPILKSKVRSDSSTGIKGVQRIVKKKSIKYRAMIYINKKTIYLGTFDTIEEATRARKLGEEKYHKPYFE